MSSRFYLPTGQYYCVQPSSTPSVSDQEWLDYGCLNGNSTHQQAYPFQNYEPRTQQDSTCLLSWDQFKNHIPGILAAPIPGANVEPHFQGSPSLPPLGPTSPGSSQGHDENVQYDPHNPSSQNTRASGLSPTKRHICPKCLYKTDKKSNLARHLETHSGNRSLFCCPKCPKKYTKNYNLKRHIKQRKC
ncbi:C2H2-type zinc finger transcription factor [Phycomyces blakesleeanus]